MRIPIPDRARLLSEAIRVPSETPGGAQMYASRDELGGLQISAEQGGVSLFIAQEARQAPKKY